MRRRGGRRRNKVQILDIVEASRPYCVIRGDHRAILCQEPDPSAIVTGRRFLGPTVYPWMRLRMMFKRYDSARHRGRVDKQHFINLFRCRIVDVNIALPDHHIL